MSDRDTTQNIMEDDLKFFYRFCHRIGNGDIFKGRNFVIEMDKALKQDIEEMPEPHRADIFVAFCGFRNAQERNKKDRVKIHGHEIIARVIRAIRNL